MAVLFAGFAWGQNNDQLKATVIKSHTLKNVPSASGIEHRKDMHYVIGDDSPWLFELDSNLNITRSILIHSNQIVEKGRIAKADKPDYESIVSFKWGKDKEFLIFGSGSDKNRNDLVRVNIGGSGYSVKTLSLNDFYSEIRLQGGIAEADFNIEGAASWAEFLILMNRGTNQLILIDETQFVDYLKTQKDGKKPKPFKARFFNYNLPIEGGVQARFSGGTKVSSEDVLIFTASLENTTDWIADGAILGSYIGLIDLNKLTNADVASVKVMQNGMAYKGKIESVDCIDVSKSKLKLTAVTDNDEGDSEFVEIELNR